MSKAFCLTDKAVEYFLHKAEEYLDYVFAEKELARLSADGFSALKDFKFLKWKQFDWEHELFVSHLPGDEGTVRYLKRRDDGKYWAYPEEETSKSRILVEEADLPHWGIDVSKLIEKICGSNKLSGKIQEWNKRLYYLGGYRYPDATIGVALGLYDCDEEAENILSVKWEDYGHDRTVVLCPTFIFNDPLKTGRFSARKIDVLSFKDALVKEGFGLQVKKDGQTAVSYRNANEKKDYEKHRYRSLDDFEYLDAKDRHSSHWIKINGVKVSVPNATFALLLFLTKMLKKNKRGYVTKDDVSKTGVTDEFRDNHIDELVFELRNKISPPLKTTDRDGIIEVDNGEYRLSIHPNRIVVPKGGWLEDTLKKTISELKKKRDKRSQQSTAWKTKK